ncbi:AhpA/YtjB family protein [Paraglaciecola sp.]|uniref:AhpA/YtjB family protein n=1 Tax=Paraglaciecola sp. TaxID=1920173 RepID=UPI003EF4163D
MENLKHTASLPSIEIPSKYSVFKRMANLLLVIIAVIICVNLWLISTNQSIDWHNKQANQLGESLSSLSANVLAESILSEDSQTLANQLMFVHNDPHVLSASLFDEKGRQLVNNQTSSSVVAAFKLNKNKPLVFVKNIQHNGQLIGYLRILLKEEMVMAYHSDYQTQLNQQLIVLMLLALGVGVLIARAFYKFKYRQKNKSDSSVQDQV